jgi:hypothetical protein
VKKLALLIVKNHLPLQFVESVWLKYLMLQLCFRVHFIFQKLFSNIVLPELVEKTKKTYVFPELMGKTNETYVFPELVEKTKETNVLPLLNDCSCVTTSFDLWMFKGAHNVFVLVINFWGFDWKPKHVSFDLFNLLKLQDKHWLKILLNF